MSRLAILGGPKTVNIPRKHFVWPPISDETQNAVLKQLEEGISIYDRSGIIETLENRFAETLSRRHALLTSSGTAALYSAFVGAGLKEGDEVICPAYTFFATVTPLFFLGAIPVLADSRDDGNIDPSDIERCITNKTKALVVTHMWGMPCDMDPICEIADRYDLILIEDASHAYGAIYHGKRVGQFGDVAVFSLQAQKVVAAGEGGVLLTDSDDIFYRALLLGHYNQRCKKEIPSDHPLYEYATTGMGLKLRIHPLAAAIANQQLDKIEQILAGRRAVADKMHRLFGSLPPLTIPNPEDRVQPSWYAFVMQYDASKLQGLPIEKFYNALKAEGCEELDRPNSTCPLNYHPLFQHPEKLFPSYGSRVRYARGDFPICEKFHERSLKLPVWNNPEDEEIMFLYFKAFQKVIEHYRDLL